MSLLDTQPSVIGFDCQPRTRLVFGLGALERLGALAVDAGMKRPLVVTDPGIVAAGHVERAVRALQAADIDAVVYDRCRENPDSSDVDACVAFARQAEIDGFVGLGGGSSMDTAKGCNFVLTNGGTMRDYQGIGKAQLPMLPLIAAPTTAGTGSECQSFALIADPETHQKMACGDPKAAACIALLDPELTVSQPRQVTACTGMDAIAHALESAVTAARTEYSMLLSHEAFRLTVRHLPVVLDEPDNLNARAQMQLGAAFAGAAIENSMLGAAHSAANPLTAHYGLVHGEAVGMMLPSVVQFNAGDKVCRQLYGELAATAGIVSSDAGDDQAVEQLIERLLSLLRAGGMPLSPKERSVPPDAFATLAEEAAAQWTAQFNPRPLDRGEFLELYHRANRRS